MKTKTPNKQLHPLVSSLLSPLTAISTHNLLGVVVCVVPILVAIESCSLKSLHHTKQQSSGEGSLEMGLVWQATTPFLCSGLWVDRKSGGIPIKKLRRHFFAIPLKS